MPKFLILTSPVTQSTVIWLALFPRTGGKLRILDFGFATLDRPGSRSAPAARFRSKIQNPQSKMSALNYP
jgi:hypothetical protein